MINRYQLGIVIGVLMMLPPCLEAQSGFQGSAGARSLGLGQISAMLNDLSAGFANAASIPFYRNQGLQVYALQRFSLSELKEIGITGAFASGKNGSFFGAIQHYGFETYSEQKLSFGYGLKLMSNFSTSVQFSVYQFRISEYGNTLQPSFEIGFYTKPFETLSLGAHISNPVPIASDNGIRIPTLIRFGGVYRPSLKLNLYGELEKDIDFPVSVKMAFEYLPVSQFVIRMGAVSDPSSYHLGFGYYVKKELRIDIGFGYSTVLGLTPGIGLSYLPLKRTS